MKTQTVAKTQNHADIQNDPLWKEFERVFEDIKHGRIKKWVPENFLAKERYCPNCKQNVYPTRSLLILVLEIVFGLAVVYWVLLFIGQSQIYPIIGLLVIAFGVLTPARKSCPLCKTPWGKLYQRRKVKREHRLWLSMQKMILLMVVVLLFVGCVSTQNNNPDITGNPTSNNRIEQPVVNNPLSKRVLD